MADREVAEDSARSSQLMAEALAKAHEFLALVKSNEKPEPPPCDDPIIDLPPEECEDEIPFDPSPEEYEDEIPFDPPPEKRGGNMSLADSGVEALRALADKGPGIFFGGISLVAMVLLGWFVLGEFKTEMTNNIVEVKDGLETLATGQTAAMRLQVEGDKKLADAITHGENELRVAMQANTQQIAELRRQIAELARARSTFPPPQQQWAPRQQQWPQLPPGNSNNGERTR